jgi:CubicO group peptidase (beta-lactamase class C family)
MASRRARRVHSRHHRYVPDLTDLLPDVDQRFTRVQRESGVPGAAWGVILNGELVHVGGTGTSRVGEERVPDADTVFRIASMTKSFTAATVLLLRDEGRLGLDDPVAAHLPALAEWRPLTADSPPVTIRQLLTMSGGLPTDDPWGDRQQGLDLDRFLDLLADGPTSAWPPGTTFEYSNLGYGILGRLITAVTGTEYREVVRDRICRPLGMTSTTYLAGDVPEARLAHGYVRRGDELTREGTDGYGALASMGGVFSTVRDLGRWVAGFLDAFPARDDPEGGHPLRRSTRREMQQVQRFSPTIVPAHGPEIAEPRIVSGGYGFGLMIWDDAATGTTIGHAGGYPGFGSHMAWHPATGLGIVALGNLRYAPMRPVAGEVLTMLLRAKPVPHRRPEPLPRTDALRSIVDGLIERWDDDTADRAFAMNMDLDEPREVRRAAVEAISRELGPFHSGVRRQVDEGRRADASSPAHLAWWLRGEHGWLRVSILITPEPVPRIQTLRLTPAGDPSLTLHGVAERLLALAADGASGWPADLPVGPDVDRDAVLRSLRAAGALLAPMSLGLPCAGDGRTSTTFEIESDRGRATLSVTIAPDTGALTAVTYLVADRSSPPEGW